MTFKLQFTSALITSLVAIYGAILSTILGINQWLEKRPRIKVMIKDNMSIVPKEFSPYPDQETILIVKAVNISQRPTTITGASLLLPRSRERKHGYLLCADSISNAMQPAELTEGQSKEYNFGETTLKNEYHLSPNQYVAVVVDNAGRSYYSHNLFQRIIRVRRTK